MAASGSCPDCGGAQRRSIGLGYWECTSDVARPGESVEPAGYGGQPVVVTRWSSGPCGTRYQEGDGSMVSANPCSCGTFAIGRCAECGRLVCGDHSVLKGDRRLCEAHAHGEQEREDNELERVLGVAARQRESDAREAEVRHGALPPATAVLSARTQTFLKATGPIPYHHHAEPH